MTAYAAFLRGINVGGNKPVPMERLKKVLESIGLENVKTILASGNAMFESSSKNPSALGKSIEAALEKTFKHGISVILRSQDDLRKLEKLNPFKGINVTKDVRLYVTFLSEKPTKTLTTAYKSENGLFKIVHSSNTEVCSFLTVSPTARSVDLMAIIEKTYGKNVTTRNWNTIGRILKAMD